MEFVLKKNIEKSWDVIPTSGQFEGQVIATTEGANVQGARFNGCKIVGAIKALWGVTIVLEDIYSDPSIIYGLCLGKRFDTTPGEALVMDRDGIKDSFSQHMLRGARRVFLLGNAVYAKGGY